MFVKIHWSMENLKAIAKGYGDGLKTNKGKDTKEVFYDGARYWNMHSVNYSIMERKRFVNIQKETR